MQTETTPAAARLSAGEKIHDLQASQELGGPPRFVNFKFLAGTVVIGCLIGASVYTLHEYQMRRLASVFLARAQHAQGQGDLQAAAKHLRRYLALGSRDFDARVELATVLHELADAPREHLDVFLRYEQILRYEPSRSSVRRRLVDIAMEFGRYRDAAIHLEYLLHENPNDGELHGLLAECSLAQGEYARAEIAYRAAIRAEPRRFEYYAQLARLLSDRLERSQEAQDALDRMVRANQTDGRAWLTRARFHFANGRTRAAILDARNAYRWAPDNQDVLVLIANLLTSAGSNDRVDRYFDPLQIRRKLEQAFAANASDVELIRALAQLEMRNGRAELAEKRLREGLRTDPANAKLQWMLADLLTAEFKTTAAEDELARLKRADPPDELIGYLEARLDMSAGRWAEAVRKLDAIRHKFEGHARAESNIALHLAECYRQLGHESRELEAHRRAIEANALSEEARLGLAASLAESGQIDDALALYGQLAHRPEVHLAVAQLLIQRNLGLPTEEQDWDPVHQELDAASRNAADQASVFVLRAGVLTAQNRFEEAQQLLERARKRTPDDVKIWVALVDLHDNRNQPEEAQRLLTEAQQRFKPSVELTLARIRHWTRQGPPEAIKRIDRLIETQSGFSSTEQTRLLSAAAEAFRSLGEKRRAQSLWMRLCELHPSHIGFRRELVETGLLIDDDPSVRRAIEELRRLEGAEGPYWKLYEASYQVALARRGDQGDLQHARKLLSDLAGELTNSPQVPLTRAALAELEGDPDAAVQYYRQALDRGETSPQIVLRTVELLFRRRQVLQAQRLLDQLRTRQRLRLTGQLGRLATEVAIQNRRRELAVELVQHVAPQSSPKAREHLWSARALWAVGQLQLAEQRFRRALELEPEQPECWVGWVDFLTKSGRRDEAREVIRQAADELPQEERSLIRAQCYELVGDFARAKQEYDAVRRMEPTQPIVIWTLADFSLRQGQLDDAEPLLRQLVDREDLDGHKLAARARRGLALVELLKRGYPGFRVGLQLLDQNFQAGGETADDLRVKARLLASRPTRRRQQEAIRVMERLDERFSLTAKDQFRLIQLHVALGEWDEARGLLHALLAANRDNADYLAYGIRTMLDYGETGGATEQWLSALVKMQPDTLRTVKLQIRRHVEMRQIDNVLKLCDTHVSPDSAGEIRGDHLGEFADFLAAMARRLDHAGRTLEADRLAQYTESLYRRFVEQSPEQRWRLIRFLGERFKLQEAFSLCERAWNENPSDALAATSVRLLHMGRPAADRTVRVRDWLAEALRRDPDSAEYHFQAGNVCNLQGDYAAAEKHYREAIELAPRAVAPRNELAVILALRRHHEDEALQVINRAIDQLAGPLPYLLDTRATVYLALGRTQEALADLEEAIADEPSPAKYFHLAQTHGELKNPSAARAAYHKGLAAGLDVSSLHPLERERFRQLVTRLKTR